MCSSHPSVAVESEPLHVVIAGGGVAGLEALIALRDLAGDRVRVTLIGPEPDFAYRALSVGEPFLASHAQRYPLARIADDFGAQLVPDAVVEVNSDLHRIQLRDGPPVDYEVLVLALGARTERAHEHAITFGEDGSQEALRGLLADAELGYVRRIAFIVPPRTPWMLPLYELALMTAADVHGMGIDDLEILLISPEERPLFMFGPHASTEVAALLDHAGIHFISSAYTDVLHGEVVMGPGFRRVAVDRVVSLPRLVGPSLPGLPMHHDGFVPTDEYGQVTGLHDVYAAGDMTVFPVKQGGIAAQQAEVVARAIAAAAGASVEPTPFRPVLRGMLLVDRGNRRFLRHRLAGGNTDAQAADYALWWPPTKVASRYLAPYLFDRDQAAALHTPPAPHIAVELPLDPPVVHGAPGAPGLELLGEAATGAARPCP